MFYIFYQTKTGKEYSLLNEELTALLDKFPENDSIQRDDYTPFVSKIDFLQDQKQYNPSCLIS